MEHYIHFHPASKAVESVSDAASRSHTSPLDLPEIFREVLSYLTHRQIRRSILLVCRQWNIVGRSSIPCISTWYHTSVSQCAPRLEELLNSGTDGLRCIAPKKNWNHLTENAQHPNQEYWTSLETALRFLPQGKQEQIKTVIMRGDFNFELNLYPLLPFFCQIKALQLENTAADKIQLDTILRLCPHLSELHIDGSIQSVRSMGTLYFESPNESIPNLTLQSLTLRQLSMDIKILEQVLKRCPELQQLQLIDMAFPKTLMFDHHTEFINAFNQITISCPGLRSLHFSPLGFWMHLDFVERIFTAFPNLRTWGTGIDNAGPFVSWSLREHIPQYLTTLEISNTQGLGLASYDACALHQFLCVAPNLLHLHVDGVLLAYPGVCILDGILPTINPTIGMTGPTLVCRNLQTLKMTYQNDRMALEKLHLYSRTIFAYIANVFPKLSELKICHTGLDFSLQGGFCLLSSLRDLVKIEICSSTSFGHLLTKNDLDWFSTEKDLVPWKDTSLIQRISWNMSIVSMKVSRQAIIDQTLLQSIASKVDQRLNSKSTGETLDEKMYQVQKASCLKNVADVLDGLRKADDRCWPFLETLRFEWPKPCKRKNPLSSLTRQLRPEIYH